MNKLIHAPIAVLFDWYDTLLNTQYFVDQRSISRVLNRLNHNEGDLQNLLYKHRKECFKHIFGDKYQEANRMYEQELEKQPLDKSMLNEGVIELLDFLKEHNIYMAIVSNKKGENLREEVCDFCIDGYFSKIIGSGDTEENKPSIRPLLAALSGSNIKPSQQVFFIGDSDDDIICAKNARCLPIFYSRYDNTHNKDVLSFSQFGKIKNFILELLKNKR